MKSFFRNYWENAAEAKIAEPSAEEQREFALAWANAHVDDARRDLQLLDSEFQEMVRRYGVQVRGNYLAASLGNAQELALVREWWADFRVKHARANAKFVAALEALAALKPREVQTHHLLPDHAITRLKQVSLNATQPTGRIQ